MTPRDAGRLARRAGLAFGSVLVLSGAACTGPQSALAPAGTEAARVAQLFWVMTAAGAVIWLSVMALALWARQGQRSPRVAYRILVGGGVVFPVLALGALLVYGLRLLPGAEPARDGWRVVVTGERWWWRVRYERPDAEPVVLANEIRLPRGQPMQLLLETPDVIHSFWLPALAGKRDLIPGRVNSLVIEAERTGVYRGACAEFCGTGHANMGFVAEVMEPAGFEAWLARQAAPAEIPEDGLARRGAELFLARGCAMCHTVRGTPARGSVGPDLTHVGSRHSIAAGRLPADHASFKRWIAHAEALKPATRMPAFPLPEAELDALAAYLVALR